MSEVFKRDQQYKAMTQIAKFANGITKETTPASITVRWKELTKCWEKYQELHELVINRSGAGELEEQNDICSMYARSSKKHL